MKYKKGGKGGKGDNKRREIQQIKYKEKRKNKSEIRAEKGQRTSKK